eukprot:TRINITY_DN1765_c0_g1_i17.p1 TRINITY_DN1765_c0_g1~~TRINITY_DN1765_c0_g1_i17.p1  ORF type:complete len:267 (-),score=33.71 TRINITY_DN1765_c0_g1_i17:186-986(-)
MSFSNDGLNCPICQVVVAPADFQNIANVIQSLQPDHYVLSQLSGDSANRQNPGNYVPPIAFPEFNSNTNVFYPNFQPNPIAYPQVHYVYEDHAEYQPFPQLPQPELQPLVYGPEQPPACTICCRVVGVLIVGLLMFSVVLICHYLYLLKESIPDTSDVRILLPSLAQRPLIGHLMYLIALPVLAIFICSRTHFYPMKVAFFMILLIQLFLDVNVLSTLGTYSFPDCFEYRVIVGHVVHLALMPVVLIILNFLVLRNIGDQSRFLCL